MSAVTAEIAAPCGGSASAADPSDSPTLRERELGAIIDAYNRVTEKLKQSHDALTGEVRRLRGQLDEKNRELERRERLAALGEMAAGVAHEVRNPLGGILLYATMLEKDLAETPEQRRLAEQISEASRRLDGIVEDILSFAGQRELRCRPVALDGLIRDVVEMLRPRWTTSGCEVCGEAVEADVVIEADAIQVQRAVLNVVSNAIEAAETRSDGRVEIALLRPRPSERFATMRVSDNGPGVSAELKDRIFNPFFTTKDSGTGLGLAIVHSVVESHGGRVSVSRRKGGGAVFSLSFPVRWEERALTEVKD